MNAASLPGVSNMMLEGPDLAHCLRSKRIYAGRFKKCINLCAAIEERKCVSRRERMFRQKENWHFKAPHR